MCINIIKFSDNVIDCRYIRPVLHTKPCLPTYMNVYIHTNIHKCTHTYTHVSAYI